MTEDLMELVQSPQTSRIDLDASSTGDADVIDLTDFSSSDSSVPPRRVGGGGKRRRVLESSSDDVLESSSDDERKNEYELNSRADGGSADPGAAAVTTAGSKPTVDTL